ncbi:hypothetical protein [Pedobacter sp. Leaf176]|uniref:hypothetical protein n=1 Tax=Pedobacter sp. Leaf176 TaxID=1736286 RepID=UPI0006FDA7D6|nr:hypothetical protein [Pedobacter sp. Leaf176]KQR69720.1 hypothetical protein ASF92_13485 [Pedobacter sp. Leaf176]
MFLAFCLVAYLIYKVYQIEKQKSYDLGIRVNWARIVNFWAVILGFIFLSLGILKYYRAVDYIKSDTAQIKEIRNALSGKWLLVKRIGFKNNAIEPNNILRIQAYFRRFPGHFFPEVYSVTVSNPEASSIPAQEIVLQNPNDEESGLSVEMKIQKLNKDTLVLRYPPFITSTKKEAIAIYERLR